MTTSTITIETNTINSNLNASCILAGPRKNFFRLESCKNEAIVIAIRLILILYLATQNRYKLASISAEAGQSAFVSMQ